MSEPRKRWDPHKIAKPTQISSTPKLGGGKTKNLCETNANKTRMKLLCELMPKYFTGAQTLIKKKGINSYKEEVATPHSPHSVLDEHNYFTSKNTILELQDAVNELGSMYDDLKHQFDTLSQVLSIKNDLILTLSTKNKVRSNVNIKNPIHKLNPRYPNWRHFARNRQALKFLTGFDTEKNLERFMKTHTSTVSTTRRDLAPEDELFLVLSRLKLGANHKDLIELFDVANATMERMFEYWVDLLDRQLLGMGIWPTCTPKRIIIDCMKVFYNSECLRRAKIVLGMTCKGMICFISDTYFGDLSEVQVTKMCGILGMLAGGDEIIADNGFLIENFLIDSVKLTKPVSVKDDPARLREVIAAKNVAERTIKSIKSYRILDMTQPPKRDAQILKICCHLVNYNRDDFWDTDIVFLPKT